MCACVSTADKSTVFVLSHGRMRADRNIQTCSAYGGSNRGQSERGSGNLGHEQFEQTPTECMRGKGT